MKFIKPKGYSLIELMVAISIFALLSVLVTQAISVTLKGTRKSDASNRVRANLDYAVSVMERQLRNANLVTTACDGTNVSRIDFLDSRDNPAFFNCNITNFDDSYIASGSARLTADVNLTACSFKCTQISGTPDSIEIQVTAVDKNSSGAESSRVSVQTRVMLRTY